MQADKVSRTLTEMGLSFDGAKEGSVLRALPDAFGSLVDARYESLPPETRKTLKSIRHRYLNSKGVTLEKQQEMLSEFGESAGITPACWGWYWVHPS